MLSYCPDLRDEADDAIRRLQLVGATNDFPWVWKNWGTDILCDWYADDPRPGEASFTFQTFSVPVPIYREIVRRFPALRFKIAAVDDCSDEFEYVSSDSRN
jgi:hypothetical protein